MRDYTQAPVLDDESAVSRLRAQPRPWTADYLAMYSSWLDGITTAPWLMSVPVDDHMVHRGDGVFEAAKCVGGRIYQFRRHLERLARSAASIGLEPPLSLDDLEALAVKVVAAGGEPQAMVRVYLSRGPGGFSTNPFECPEPGLYIVASRLKPVPEEKYATGAAIGISRVPAKSGFFASVKSCNYLPNVLLAREAKQRGWDFAIGLDDEGFLAEGSTENIGLVDHTGRLALPPPGHILEGLTLRRAMELAPPLVERGVLAGVVHRPLSVADLETAREVMLFGTTLDVLPVCRLEDRPVGSGRPGPAARELLALMRADIASNPGVSTPVFA
jgi:branched-chain amino acid aminotransferase